MVLVSNLSICGTAKTVQQFKMLKSQNLNDLDDSNENNEYYCGQLKSVHILKAVRDQTCQQHHILL